MKICIILLALLPLSVISYPANTSNDKSVIKHNKANEKSDKTIDPVVEYADDNDETARSRRSGSNSFDFVNQVKNSITSSIYKGSASLSAGSSHGSSGSSSKGTSHDYGHDEGHSDTSFNGWQLKKSILNTLFQAVKAITGGVTAIKGQLIKGSGYLASGAGKLIAASGDKVTNVGVKIVNSAKLVPIESHANKFSLSSLSSGHSAPTGPSEIVHYEPVNPNVHYHEHVVQIPPSSPTGPSGSGHHGGNAYLPPVSSSHSTHYHGPTGASGYANNGPSVSSYGAALDEPAANYGHNKYEYPTAQQIPAYPPLTGPSDSLDKINEIKQQVHGKAADVLREILKKLPAKEFAQSNDIGTSYHTSNTQNNHVEQYAIPPDPVPTFKPLVNNQHQSFNQYQTLYQAPIESVTHTQSIMTAYGAPISSYQGSVSLVDVNGKQWNQGQEQSIPFHNTYNEPLNIYHLMSIRNRRDHNGSQEYLLSRSSNMTQNNIRVSVSSDQRLLPTSMQLQKDTSVQNNGLTGSKFKNSIGGNTVEIHKSIGFEIPAKRRHFIQNKKNIHNSFY